VSGRRWQAHGGVKERRWREGGKDLERKWFGEENGYRMDGDVFSKFDFLKKILKIIKKILKAKRPFPRRKGSGRGRLNITCLSLLFYKSDILQPLIKLCHIS